MRTESRTSQKETEVLITAALAFHIFRSCINNDRKVPVKVILSLYLNTGYTSVREVMDPLASIYLFIYLQFI